jgi:tetratricopeptide (TPR) repeat protein
MEQGKYEEAVQVCTNALQRMEFWYQQQLSGEQQDLIQLASYYLYCQRSRAWYGYGNYGSAVSDATKAIALNNTRRKAYLCRAAALLKLGRVDSATKDTVQAYSVARSKPSSLSISSSATPGSSVASSICSSVQFEYNVLPLSTLCLLSYATMLASTTDAAELHAGTNTMRGGAWLVW